MRNILIATCTITIILVVWQFMREQVEKSALTIQKSNPVFNVDEAEFNKSLNGTKISWNYSLPTQKDITMFIGDDCCKTLVFHGKLSGTGDVNLMTWFLPEKNDTLYVDIKECISGKLLYSQKLVNEVISVNSVPTRYILYTKR